MYPHKMRFFKRDQRLSKILKCFKREGSKERKYDLRVLKNTFKARQEIELLRRVCESPFFVSIVDVYENRYRNDDILLVVMEGVEEGELFDWIKSQGRTPFTERDAALIVRLIALALMHIHKINIAHRDIKPENLLYQIKNGKHSLKLTDFRYAKETSFLSCQTGVLSHIIESEKRDKLCDLWSLGVIMYTLLCGYPPFYRKHIAHPDLKELIRAGQYSFPDSEWKIVSNNAKDLVNCLLKRDASQLLTIQQVLEHPWMSCITVGHNAPLHTANLLTENENLILDISDSMSEELQMMRSPPIDIIHLKEINFLKNPLIVRRKKKKTVLK